MDPRLGLLALGHIAVDQHKPAARYWVVTHLDDAAVGTCPLDGGLAGGARSIAAQLRFRIHRPELAALRQIADVVGIVSRLGQEPIRQVEDLDEVAVPGGEPQLLIGRSSITTPPQPAGSPTSK